MLVLNTAACPGSQSGEHGRCADEGSAQRWKHRDIMEKHSQLPLTMTLLMPIYRKSFLELLDQCFIYKYLTKTLLSILNVFCHLSSGSCSQVTVTLNLSVEQTETSDPSFPQLLDS